ncbi:MAG: diguanylate cyclase [Massilia sp.]
METQLSNPAMDESADTELILIIDDSVDAIRLLSTMLRDQASIIFATDGAAGIVLARQRRPQLILLDVQMQAMDGHEVCRQLKADPDLRDIAVIFATGSSGIDSEVDALEAGAVDFITKPFNQAVVRARVRTHLKLQRALAALERLANVDQLTGLCNRRMFDTQLASEFARHRRQALSLGLIFIDIDYFKAYNDLDGHQAGDACLRAVGRLIESATKRPSELVARYGGEEFVVILPYTSETEALAYAERLCAIVREAALAHRGSAIADIVTISIGVAARVPGPEATAAELLRAADEALYLAKACGRDRVCSIARQEA